MPAKRHLRWLVVLLLPLYLAACGGGAPSPDGDTGEPPPSDDADTPGDDPEEGASPGEGDEDAPADGDPADGEDSGGGGT